MNLRHVLALGALASVAFLGSAQANTLAADGSWAAFDVSVDAAPSYGLGWIDINDGSALSFSFTVDAGFQGHLTVVDAVFSGDVFAVSANGVALAHTSAAVDSYVGGSSVGYDYDAALANSDYSRGVYQFGAGSYTVTGALFSSAQDELGAPLNATNGALRLTVSAVPESSTLAMLLAGLGLLAAVRRRTL